MTGTTTMDAEAKERVVAALLAHVQAQHGALAAAADDEEQAAHVDRDQPMDEPERAQADEMAELTAEVERAETRQEQQAAQVAALDFSPTDVVRDGAVVSFGGGRYVVGVVTDAFDCDGETYEGISADSPVHERLVGLRAGDTVTVAGREHRLDLVA